MMAFIRTIILFLLRALPSGRRAVLEHKVRCDAIGVAPWPHGVRPEDVRRGAVFRNWLGVWSCATWTGEMHDSAFAMVLQTYRSTPDEALYALSAWIWNGEVHPKAERLQCIRRDFAAGLRAIDRRLATRKWTGSPEELCSGDIFYPLSSSTRVWYRPGPGRPDSYWDLP